MKNYIILSISLLSMLLGACTHQQPNGPGHYVVKGKTYHVMKSAKHYKAKGIASWYRAPTRKHKTLMTAAHPTLPLATHVRVKNLNNGRSIVVQITDRGPFLSNRLIDLSFAAAKKLQIKGIAPVEIETV